MKRWYQHLLKNLLSLIQQQSWTKEKKKGNLSLRGLRLDFSGMCSILWGLHYLPLNIWFSAWHRAHNRFPMGKDKLRESREMWRWLWREEGVDKVTFSWQPFCPLVTDAPSSSGFWPHSSSKNCKALVCRRLCWLKLLKREMDGSGFKSGDEFVRHTVGLACVISQVHESCAP